MRFFPSAARQRLAVASVAGAVSLGLLASSLNLPAAHADDDPLGLKQKAKQVQGAISGAADDLDEASKQVTRTTRRLESASAQLGEARATVDAVNERLVSARVRDAELQQALRQSEKELAQANAELEAGRQAVDDQRDQVRDNVLDIYTQGDPQLRAIGSFLGASSLEDLSRAQAAEDVIVGRGTQVFDDLGEIEEQLDAQQDRVKTATETVAAKKKDAEDHLAVVGDLYEEAQVAKRRVDAMVDRSRAARADAFAARKADRAELAALKQREAAIKQKILAAARRDTSPGFTGSSGGFLSYPANAPVTSPFGYRVHPIYGYYSLHNGTDFGVACGTPLVASAAGTVSDEYYDSAYGNRLYLNVGNVNGKNLTLVYNHLSGYKASEGQRVDRGDVVAYSGTTGWSTGCHLHFTVLVNGEPVDPMGYL